MIIPLTVWCKSNANVIQRISRIFDDNKQNYVWSVFFNDISRVVLFERQRYFTALRDSSSEITWHSTKIRAKFHGTL